MNNNNIISNNASSGNNQTTSSPNPLLPLHGVGSISLGKRIQHILNEKTKGSPKKPYIIDDAAKIMIGSYLEELSK